MAYAAPEVPLPAKTVPSLLNESDIVGFDLHCLVKFNVFSMTKLLVKSYLNELHEMGYPAEVLHHDFDSDICQTSVVWDIEHGTLIKLGPNK